MSDHELAIIEGEILGDAEQTAMATGAAAEILKSLGGIGAQAQAKKEQSAAEKKAKAEAEAKASASAADIAAAQKAAVDAQIAALEAGKEKDPAGPAHIAAIRANALAQQLAAKIGGVVPPGGQPQSSSGPSFLTKRHAGIPTYGWGLIGLATIGAVVGVVKLLGRGKTVRR